MEDLIQTIHEALNDNLVVDNHKKVIRQEDLRDVSEKVCKLIMDTSSMVRQ